MPWRTPKLRRLARAIHSLKNEDEIIDFLRDLCTLEELEEFSSRWEAVQLLGLGLSYRDIAKKAELSTTTVTRIAHWLRHGEGGYGAALKRVKKA